ncbi:hypothetical protein JG688_00013074 [Phytophthora aleatoria]|uniref:Tc1-like transposase DDE domain-containing protein n=1 Tax=Phytophthora aleatoria TaxID=2496075 RepID=A0A8J5IA91_9STRA|nr:hypothetical protein JG688_00013074 [Phytophthora aleatoria]
MDVQGFFTWGDVEDTFTRASFHDVFKPKILPFLNPWPLPRSIVVMDKAKIHMYKELQEMIHETAEKTTCSAEVADVHLQSDGNAVYLDVHDIVLCVRYLLITLHCVVHCHLLRIYLLKLSKCRVVWDDEWAPSGSLACVTAM